MVTTAQMTGFAMAIVLPILAGAVPYYLFWKRSSKIEAGMMGAFGYGVFGYFWQEIIYGFLGTVLLSIAYTNKEGSLAGFLNATGGSEIIVAIIEALFSGVFVALGLYWGIYLTNKKQRSLYRSATVGIGFGVGYAVFKYGFQLYYAIKINQGTFAGTDAAKASILNTSVGTLYVASYRNILMVIIFMGIALLMGNYHLEKNYASAWITPIAVYVFIRFTDVILNAYLPLVASRTIMCIILSGLVAVCLWLIVGMLKNGKVSLGSK